MWVSEKWNSLYPQLGWQWTNCTLSSKVQSEGDCECDLSVRLQWFLTKIDNQCRNINIKKRIMHLNILKSQKHLKMQRDATYLPPLHGEGTTRNRQLGDINMWNMGVAQGCTSISLWLLTEFTSQLLNVFSEDFCCCFSSISFLNHSLVLFVLFIV